MEWLETIGTFVAGMISGAAGIIPIWDRVQKHRTRIVGEIEIEVFPADQPGENPWDPPIIDPDQVDGILVTATVHNNTDAPLIPKRWVISGPGLVDGPPYVRVETIPPKQTGVLSTAFVPDWEAWNRQLEASLISRPKPLVRCTLVGVSRSHESPIKLVGRKVQISAETVRHNAAKAKALRTRAAVPAS